MKSQQITATIDIGLRGPGLMAGMNIAVKKWMLFSVDNTECPCCKAQKGVNCTEDTMCVGRFIPYLEYKRLHEEKAKVLCARDTLS